MGNAHYDGCPTYSDNEVCGASDVTAVWILMHKLDCPMGSLQLHYGLVYCPSWPVFWRQAASDLGLPMFWPKILPTVSRLARQHGILHSLRYGYSVFWQGLFVWVLVTFYHVSMIRWALSGRAAWVDDSPRYTRRDYLNWVGPRFLASHCDEEHPGLSPVHHLYVPTVGRSRYIQIMYRWRVKHKWCHCGMSHGIIGWCWNSQLLCRQQVLKKSKIIGRFNWPPFYWPKLWKIFLYGVMTYSYHSTTTFSKRKCCSTIYWLSVFLNVNTFYWWWSVMALQRMSLG